jgi:hypothetical protein
MFTNKLWMSDMGRQKDTQILNKFFTASGTAFLLFYKCQCIKIRKLAFHSYMEFKYLLELYKERITWRMPDQASSVGINPNFLPQQLQFAITTTTATVDSIYSSKHNSERRSISLKFVIEDVHQMLLSILRLGSFALCNGFFPMANMYEWQICVEVVAGQLKDAQVTTFQSRSRHFIRSVHSSNFRTACSVDHKGVSCNGLM